MKALRKAAGAMDIVLTNAHRLQQVQVAHGAVYALLAVPRTEATRWLRASGCGGVFLRPFWTKDTSPELERNRFNLLWLRGQRDFAMKLWDAIHDMDGIFGLLVADRDVAIRIRDGAQRSELEARVKLVLKDRNVAKVLFHQATPNLRWWRLGPLEDADVFNLEALIVKTGLTEHRDVRLGSSGPFRRVAYFAACGEPVRTSLDDGGWGRGCSAVLTPASPPPRPSAGRQSSDRPGPALAANSSWGGPRGGGKVVVASGGVSHSAKVGTVAEPSRTSTALPGGVHRGTGRQAGGGGAVRPKGGDGAVTSVAAAGKGRLGNPWADGGGGGASSSLEVVLQGLQSELVALNKRLAELTQENTELRRELQALRAAEPRRVAGGASQVCGQGLVQANLEGGGGVESEPEDVDMANGVAGRRYRDASDVSPGKPRKGARRTVSEGATPHGF